MAQFIVRDLEDDVKVRLKHRAARLAGRTGSGAYPALQRGLRYGDMITVTAPR